MSFQAIREIIDANVQLERDAKDAILRRIDNLKTAVDENLSEVRSRMLASLDDLAQIIAEKSSDLIGEAQDKAMKQAAE